MYTIYTSDATTPVTIHYMAFNEDGSMPIETLTRPGPFVNFISYPCTGSDQRTGRAAWEGVDPASTN